MAASLSKLPTIRTVALERLESLFLQAAHSAELAIVKGPAGCGKTMAIRHLQNRLPDIEVFTATMRPDVAGRVSRMTAEILGVSRSYWRASECTDVLWNTLARRPFSRRPTRSLLVIDEAQMLQTKTLDALRSLFDMGDTARLLREEAPAFGMVLVGNAAFLDRAGGVRAAAYAPLVSRVCYDLELSAPDRKQFEHFVDALPGIDELVKAELVQFGLETGNLRSVVKAWRAAQDLDATMALDTVRACTSFMGARA